ncbi:MAG: ATP:cob(I)alamin adenosyltransferase, partial [Chloroflexi bacterium]|nr:ATP:cob(I)alamin adenosyltransferase [Chloroflexota bacterium]
MSTWRGDLGYSDLIGEHGISKADPCFDVLGTLDEASAALGLARALAIAGYTKEQILQVQEHLCWMMSELAARDPVADGHYILAEHVAWLDEQ